MNLNHTFNYVAGLGGFVKLTLNAVLLHLNFLVVAWNKFAYAFLRCDLVMIA